MVPYQFYLKNIKNQRDTTKLKDDAQNKSPLFDDMIK